MPISEKVLKNLKVTNQEGREVDLLLLKWPPEETLPPFLAEPVREASYGFAKECHRPRGFWRKAKSLW